MRAISLGAGVQSTVVALTEDADCAIFADTGWEPKAVYSHLDWLETQLSYPIYRVSQGNLKDAVTNPGFSAVPFYTKTGMGARQCTYQYKLRPIYRKVRDLLGGTPKGGCDLLLGISTDEMIRMKDARVQYVVNKFPLVDRGMSRQDCLRWLEINNYPRPPRSACLGCPFKRDSEWRDLKKSSEWDETVEADRMIRANGKSQFMHRSCKPLNEVDLSTAEDHGQLSFLGECDGMCGV